jgi:two-component system cell cycle sensor histidine kinase/response regulator CckA
MVSAAAVLQREGFSALFSAYPDAALVYEAGAGIVRVNAALAQLSGYTEEELLRLAPQRLVARRQLADFSRHAKRVFRNETERFRTKLLTRNGAMRPVDVTLIPLRNREERVVAVLALARDLAALEEAIRMSDYSSAILRVAGRVGGVGGWTIDAATGMGYISDEVGGLLGRDVPEAIHWENRLRAYSEQHRALLRDGILRALEHAEPMDITVELATGRDGTRLMRFVGEPVTGADGRVLRLDGAVLDVTDVVERQRELARVDGLLTTTLDQMSAGIAFIDRAWRFTYINDTGARMIGSTPGTLIGRSIWDAFPGAETTEFGEAYRRSMSDRVRTRVRGFYGPLEGWFEASTYPIDEGIAVQLLDVTEEQHRDRALQQTAERATFLSELLDVARDAIVVVDNGGRVSYWNHGAELVYGWTSAQAVGQPIRHLIYEDPTQFDRAARELGRFGVYTGEQEHRSKDGRSIIADCRWQAVEDSDGNRMSMLLVQSDITEYRKMQEKRQRDQRMESLGTLAGGIAHDLNNVLTPVLMAAQLLARDEEDQRKRTLLSSIESAATRGAEMIARLLAFARGEPGRTEPVDMVDLLREFAALAEQGASPNVTVTFELADELPAVLADRTQLLRVLLNLVSNADHATRDRGGTVLVKAYPATGAPPVGSSEPSGDQVIVEVVDAGVGMDSETQRRAFEPFFTTKSRGTGTGLGLAASLSIVEQYGGSVEVESSPGAGSRFIVRLPAAGEPVPEARPRDSERDAPAQGRSQTVLVVDDVPEVRSVVGQALEKGGYLPLTAIDGQHALEVLADASRVDLVVLDLTMPGMDGAETAARISALRADLPILLISGMDTTSARNRVPARTTVRFLAKPFTDADLLREVSALLNEGGR